MIDDGQLLINFSRYNYSCVEFQVPEKAVSSMLNHSPQQD